MILVFAVVKEIEDMRARTDLVVSERVISQAL
jgi:hypothetical protein